MGIQRLCGEMRRLFAAVTEYRGFFGEHAGYIGMMWAYVNALGECVGYVENCIE